MLHICFYSFASSSLCFNCIFCCTRIPYFQLLSYKKKNYQTSLHHAGQEKSLVSAETFSEHQPGGALSVPLTCGHQNPQTSPSRLVSLHVRLEQKPDQLQFVRKHFRLAFRHLRLPWKLKKAPAWWWWCPCRRINGDGAALTAGIS